MNTKLWINIILQSVFIIAVVFFIYYFYPIKQENLLFKTILNAQSQYSDVSITDQTAKGHYDEASFAYEKSDYSSVESNCRLARDSFSTASQKYKDISSYLEKTELKDKLINISIKEYDTLSEIDLNLYEACEHFESASRYYAVYSNVNTPYNDPSFESGNAEIRAMNVKIDLHDENVRKYNDLLSEFKTELENRLK